MKIGSYLWGRGSESERALSRVFSWLTRSRLGPAFGSRPIGWYQAHQIHAIEELERRAVEKRVIEDAALGPGKEHEFEVRVTNGIVQARAVGGRRWVQLGSAHEIYAAADSASRK